MKRSHDKIREEARRLFLSGEVASNAEIAARLKVKPHTIGRWRREEDWDGLRLKIDRRAAELFVEKIATETVTLNLNHYNYWAVLLAELTRGLKGDHSLEYRELERIAGIIEKAQKGQRLAKGLSTTGDTEETIRAQSHAEIRRVVDAVISAVKENIADEEVRDRIRHSILASLPEDEDEGAGDGEDEGDH